MDWNIKTASGRDKLRIRERKLRALYEMQPDLLPGHPGKMKRIMLWAVKY